MPREESLAGSPRLSMGSPRSPLLGAASLSAVAPIGGSKKPAPNRHGCSLAPVRSSAAQYFCQEPSAVHFMSVPDMETSAPTL